MDLSNHMYGHPNSALSYTCENLWQCMVGLERLEKSHEIHSAESHSVDVRQGCCFCSSTFYFKAAPELQSMMQRGTDLECEMCRAVSGVCH